MVVDTSAILAILLEEPEAAIVLFRADRKLADKLDQLVAVSAITTIPFGAEHVAAAKMRIGNLEKVPAAVRN